MENQSLIGKLKQYYRHQRTPLQAAYQFKIITGQIARRKADNVAAIKEYEKKINLKGIS